MRQWMNAVSLFEAWKPKTLRLYHSSPNDDITAFRPLSHFGTEAAARKRASDTKYKDKSMILYAVDFSTGVPVRIRDFHDIHGWSNITDMLHYTMKKIEASDRDHIYKMAAPSGRNTQNGIAGLIFVLQNRGYDSIVYRNKYEDAGHDSWINLTSDQVKIVEKIAIDKT